MEAGLVERPDARVAVAVVGDVDLERRRLAAHEGVAGLKPGRAVLVVSSRCRIGACEVSMPPSRPCSQLHSWITFDTWMCVAGTRVHAKCGGGGIRSGGPM